MSLFQNRGALVATMVLIALAPESFAGNMTKRTLPQIDTDCRLSFEQRARRIRFIDSHLDRIHDAREGREKMRALQLDELKKFENGYTASRVALGVSLVAGAMAGGLVASETFAAGRLAGLGGKSLQWTAEGLKPVVTNVSRGKFLMSGGYRVWVGRWLTIPKITVNAYEFLGLRGLMTVSDSVELALPVGRKEAHLIQQKTEAFEDAVLNAPYIGNNAVDFLRDPQWGAGNMFGYAELENPTIEQIRANTAKLEIDLTRDIGEVDSMWRMLTDFHSQRKARLAAVEVAVSTAFLNYLDLKAQYWRDLRTILIEDEASCRSGRREDYIATSPSYESGAVAGDAY